jgi:hypothetical protein
LDMRSERTSEICPEIGNLIEGYAIGALDADEMLHVAQVIAECPDEQRRLQEYEETIGLLGLTARALEPPDSLWQRLEESTSEDAFREPISIESRRSNRITLPRWTALLVSAAAILLFVATISLGVALRQSDDDGGSFESAMATYLTSGGAVIPLASLSTPEYLNWGGRGSLVVAPNMAPMVIVDRCVPSSRGYEYIVWLQRGDQRTPMGEIEINKDGRGMMELHGIASLETYDVLGISIHTSQDKVYDVITGAPRMEN